MPKLSVYVPDELWEQAKALAKSADEKVNNSQVVQKALERAITEREDQRAALRASAVRDEPRLVALVGQFRDAARYEYEQGYAAMLDLIELEATDYDGLRSIKSLGGTLQDAINWVAAGGLDDHEEWLNKNAMYFDNEAGGFYLASDAWRDGAQQAMDDVWAALRANAWGTGTAADETESGEDEDEGEVQE